MERNSYYIDKHHLLGYEIYVVLSNQCVWEYANWDRITVRL